MGGNAVNAVLVPAAILAAVSVAGMALLRAADARSARSLEASLAAPPADARFNPRSLADLPEPARRYLAAAIAPGTPLARSARLTMEGRMRLQGEWFPMHATETLSAEGFVWMAGVERGGTPVDVWDSLGPEGGRMRAWLMGLVPVVRSGGDDLTRSAAGRLAAELIWLPAALLPEAGVTWEAVDADTARATFDVAGQTSALHLRVDAAGHLTALWLERRGDPERSGTFRAMVFGGDVAESAAFGGFRIPTRLTAGWGYGTGEYAPFFDATITGADFSGQP